MKWYGKKHAEYTVSATAPGPAANGPVPLLRLLPLTRRSALPVLAWRVVLGEGHPASPGPSSSALSGPSWGLPLLLPRALRERAAGGPSPAALSRVKAVVGIVSPGTWRVSGSPPWCRARVCHGRGAGPGGRVRTRRPLPWSTGWPRGVLSAAFLAARDPAGEPVLLARLGAGPHAPSSPGHSCTLASVACPRLVSPTFFGWPGFQSPGVCLPRPGLLHHTLKHVCGPGLIPSLLPLPLWTHCSHVATAGTPWTECVPTRPLTPPPPIPGPVRAPRPPSLRSAPRPASSLSLSASLAYVHVLSSPSPAQSTPSAGVGCCAETGVLVVSRDHGLGLGWGVGRRGRGGFPFLRPAQWLLLLWSSPHCGVPESSSDPRSPRLLVGVFRWLF